MGKRIAGCVLALAVFSMTATAAEPAPPAASAMPNAAQPNYADLLKFCNVSAGVRMPTEREIALLGPFWPKLPPEKNAAYLLAKAEWELEENCKTLPEPPGSLSSEEPYTGDAAGFLRYVRANQNVLDQVRKAVDLPFEEVCFINDREAAVWLPVLAGSRNLARFLLDAGFAAELEGKPALAADRCLNCLRLGAKLRNGGTCSQFLVGIAILGFGPVDLARLLANAELDEAALKRVIAVCRECECPPGLLKDLVRREIQFFEAQDALFARHEAERMRRLASEVEKQSQLPIQEYIKFCEAHQEPDKQYSFPGAEDPADSLLHTRATPQRIAVVLREIEIRAAINLFRKAHGAPPGSLEELVPAFLPEVPADPFDGQPLRYKRLGHGWKIWSKGESVATFFHLGSSLIGHSDLPPDVDRRLRQLAPIHEAAKTGDLAKVEALVKENPDVVFRPSYGDWETPLHYATVAGRKAVAEFLLANKADVNAEDLRGETPLHGAAANGQKDICDLLLANGADVNAADRWGQTPLHLGCSFSDESIAASLLEKNADPNARDNQGVTPLHWAACNNTKIAELLLAHHADVNAKDNSGSTPLLWAAARGEREVVDFLLANKAVVTTIHEAAALGDLEKLKALLKADPDSVSRRAYEEKTPLHFAAAMGQAKAAALLLAAKADVNARDIRGATPLHDAVSGGSVSMAELLLAAKAEVDARDNDGSTPLALAVYHDNKELAALLLANKADVNAVDNRGRPHLRWAIYSRKADLVQLLLDNKADVNFKDKDGITPLRYAISLGYNDIADLLRRHGAKE